MPRKPYSGTETTIQFEGKIVNYSEKQMKSHITVPFSWSKKHLGKTLRVKIEVVDE